MAGNMIDLPDAQLDLIGIRGELDTIGQQLHNAVHQTDDDTTRENLRCAADDVMQAWAKVTVATTNLAIVLDVRSPAPAVPATTRATGGLIVAAHSWDAPDAPAPVVRYDTTELPTMPTLADLPAFASPISPSMYRSVSVHDAHEAAPIGDVL